MVSEVAMGTPLIEVEHISKIYRMGDESQPHALRVLNAVDSLEGESVAVMGPSGRGKSTH